MSTITNVPASYKKKDGTISLSADGKSLVWRQDPSSPSSNPSSAQITISVDAITNLQATPPTSSKVMIKVFAQSSAKGTNDQYVFTFNCSHDEASHLKAALAAAIQSLKSAGAPGNASASDDKDNSSNKQSDLYKSRTDNELKNDMSLQQAVLSSSPSLQKAFHEVVVEGNVTAAQFWSTRIHLLRAHLVEQSQVRGSYNVLATIKPKTEDSIVRVSLSRDQIHTIFEQHPIVRQIYDEVVPKLREDEFWRRFFLSKLYKRLKGEKLVATDAHDDVLDQYLKAEILGSSERGKQISRVPHIIDVGGNEDDHSQKQGNRPDLTMRPNKTENVPIIRTLNHLSSKLLDAVKPIDLATSGSDNEANEIAELRLLDLQLDTQEQNILLTARDHKQFFEADPGKSIIDASKYRPLETNATSLISDLYQSTVGHEAFKWTLEHNLPERHSEKSQSQKSLSFDDDENASLRSACSHLSSILNARRVEMPGKNNRASGDSRYSGQQIWDQLLLTHATSSEFLRHFWDAFFSGDAKRSAEIRHMVDSLTRSLDRIEAISNSAGNGRHERGNEQRDNDNKRQKGRGNLAANELTYATVKRMIAPQEVAIKTALAKYHKALENVGDAIG
ncbi:RNA polymerase II transcription factor B subunit 1, variant 3 [Orbilia brochopaga]